MPYTKEADRKKVVEDGKINLDGPSNAGDLNYAITMLIKSYYDLNGKRYQQINDIVGALRGAELEFYRRVVTPYEDKKITENGDVY